MKRIDIRLILMMLLNISLSACHLPNRDGAIPTRDDTSILDNDVSTETTQEDKVEIVTEIGSESIPDGALSPESLIYLGAFRLPEDSDGMGWEYSGQGMTFYPEGDVQGSQDNFPGSLFIVGHDQQLYVAEISIPEPTISRNIQDLYIAQTIQSFADITAGYISEDLSIPRLGIAYLPAQLGQEEGKLHFTVGQHFQEFEPSHGWASLDLSNPNTAGLWVFDGYTNYVTSDYLFAVPDEWASTYANGCTLATGRFREGVWGGLGPALFAYAPWEDGNPPAAGQVLTTIQPLLLFGIQVEGLTDIQTDDSMRMNGYGEADHWLGGAWLTSASGDAVIFTGTKAIGENWYGFANGVVWDYDCADDPDNPCPGVPDFPYDNRGYWAEDFMPAILFFDPADLAKVAQGETESYTPQPYALMDLSVYWFDPETNVETYKRDLVGAAAFDRENGLLYIVERLADEYRSVIHVFQVGGN